MNEKELIEKATADAFLFLYNNQNNTTFKIEKYSDALDVQCLDDTGRRLNLEITTTEDRVGDMQARLGRSAGRSFATLRQSLIKLHSGQADILETVSCLQANVMSMLISRVLNKFDKDYGKNTALVVRDISPVDWDWDLVRDEILKAIESKKNPFDKGIWIISSGKDKLWQIL